MTWLNEGKTCPDDNCSLGEGDIFPDTMAHREILQLKVRCPNVKEGCDVTMAVADVESHIRQQCGHRRVAQGQRHGESVTCASCGELVPEKSISRYRSLLIPPFNDRIKCFYASF